MASTHNEKPHIGISDAGLSGNEQVFDQLDHFNSGQLAELQGRAASTPNRFGFKLFLEMLVALILAVAPK